jgi:yecA family protein
MKVDYDEVNAELGAVHAGMRASECHGFLCGHFCSSNSLITDSWQEHLLAGIDDTVNVEDCVAILEKLANQVKLEILSEDISFDLLLPEDDAAMSTRSSALAEWCAGFASGLGLGGMTEKTQLNKECDEFVKDVISISRMETTMEEGEEAEAALFEIVEYIRVGTIMLHQELHQIDINEERPEVLH